MKWHIAILAVGMLAASGCARNSADTASSRAATSYPTEPAASPSAAPANDRDAIEQAVRQHLSENGSLNMAAMDMNMGQVSINGEQAQADAQFRLKTGGPAMQMTYSLQRHASGWIVTKGEPSGGQFVHPPMDKNHSPAAAAPGQSGPPDVTAFLKALPPAQAPKKTGQ